MLKEQVPSSVVYVPIVTSSFEDYKSKGGVLSESKFQIAVLDLKRIITPDWSLFYRIQGIESSLIMNGYDGYFVVQQIPESVKTVAALLLDYLSSRGFTNDDLRETYKSLLKITDEQAKNYSFSKEGIEALLTEAFAFSPLEESFREHYNSFMSE